MPNAQPDEMQDSGSIVVGQPDNSGQHVDGLGMLLIVNQMMLHDLVIPIEHQLGLLVNNSGKITFGPVAPPSFFWDRAAKRIIPSILSAMLPRNLYMSTPLHICLAKRNWNAAFDINSGFKIQCINDTQKEKMVVVVKHRSLARALYFDGIQSDAGLCAPLFAGTPEVSQRKKGKNNFFRLIWLSEGVSDRVY